MANLPPIELLESTHQFPCRYTFKVIGTAEGDFAERVVSAVAKVLTESHDAVFSQRTSSGGRHISITVAVTVPSAACVHKLYEQFLTLPGLKMVL